MKKRKKGRRFKTWAIRQPLQPRIIEREPEDLATSVSRFGEVTGGIVNHPETNVWQRGMRADGPCTFPAASRDPAKAQSNLKQTSVRAGREGTIAKIAALSRQVQSQADGELKQLPYEKMLSHLKLADERAQPLSCLTERRGDTY